MAPVKEMTEIGFWGGMALLISSITGPGMTTIPLLFQQAGWLTPIIVFILFGIISALASLFLVETMSTIHGNEAFQAKVEYSTVAHLYLGRKAHIMMQVLLYCALQSVNLSSIIISNQTMDSLLIQLFHKTCAVSFTEGWVCVKDVTSSGSPFNTYILFSFGYIISAALVLPLSVMSLVQNIKFQMASVVVLFSVLAIWVFLFAHHGLDRVVPTVGTDQSSLVGFVLANFAFITTVPSFINELSRKVSIHRTIIYSLIVCVILYVLIGIFGAASFDVSETSSILATLVASNQSRALTITSSILFPVAVLVTSVPVFSIVIRYNLVRGGLCSNRWAIFWASFLPWLVIIPLQTKGYLILIMNWTSLIFGSTTNFIIPIALYIASKVYSASTIDSTGGDLFILHDDVRSHRSIHRMSEISSRHSIHVANFRELPRLITTAPAGEDDPSPDHSTAPNTSNSAGLRSRASSLLPDQALSLGPKKNPDADLSEQELEENIASSSSLVPVRVIYSPSVSRRPTIGSSTSRRGSSTAERPNLQRSVSSQRDEEAVKSSSPSPRISPERRSLGGENTRLRRRSSAATTGAEHLSPNISIPQSSPASSSHVRQRSQGSISSLAIEENRSELELPPPHFVALRRRRWLDPILVAKLCLVIVSLFVLGNIIYDIIETAKGNDPLS